MRCKLWLLAAASLQLCGAWQNNAPPAAAKTTPAAVTAPTGSKAAAAAAPVTDSSKGKADAKPGQGPGQGQGQSQSIEAMLASVDKQKSSVQSQAGSAGAGDSFFTTAWTSPASIPVPGIIPTCPAMADSDLKPLIEESAKAQDLKPELIRAVIRHESASYPCAVSERGALGLMQLMPEVAQQFNVDPLEPKQNIQAGSRYLKQLMTRYKGNMKLALAAYNAGPQRVDGDNKVPDIPETTAYVDAIIKDLTINASPAVNGR